jgi:hypothetical protein
VVDTNRYSVPAEYAGCPLTLKTYPDRICLYSDNKLIARHARSYHRHQDIEDPDHPRQLLIWRKKAREQKIIHAFFGPVAQSRAILSKPRTAPHEPFSSCPKDRGLKRDLRSRRPSPGRWKMPSPSRHFPASILSTCSNSARRLPEPGALHLTRREDLLDLDGGIT